MTIQRNWHHRVHKTNKNKAKTLHNMCRTPPYVNKHKSHRTQKQSVNRRTDNTMANRKGTKNKQTTKWNTLHRKLKI